MKNFFTHLLSVDELKFSSLILCLFASLGFGLWMYYEHGDINESLVTIIIALITAISGLNVATLFTGNNKSSSDEESK